LTAKTGCRNIDAEMCISDYIFLTVLIVALTGGWIYALTGSLKRCLHLLQLEDYSPRRMWRIIIRRPILLQPLGFELIGALVIIAAGFIAVQDLTNRVYSDPLPRLNVGLTGAFINWFLPIGLTIWGLGCAWRGWQVRRILRKTKKSLVMTARARRIFWTGLTFSLVFFFVLALIVFFQYVTKTAFLGGCIYMPDGRETLLIIEVKAAVFLWIGLLAAMYLVERVAAIWLSISVWILSPLEASIQRRYLKDARRILSEINPIVIGITGSYGKTGTKEMLTAMLAEKYSVFCPPGSYNTLMGVTRVIREQLRPYHELFVVEMGAYRVGSIRRLCELVNPKFGIITIVGVQHLERFKTRENIKIAKGELIRALPDDGTAVLNGDDPACREIGTAFEGEVVYFRIDDGIADKNVCATGSLTVLVKNIRIGIDGTDFDLVFNGDSYPVHLSLLGRSAVSNATAAAAMADRLGVPRKAIKSVLARMPHVRHRLEPIRREGNITVLDDAFNSNPIGAKNALEVLATAEDGRRILVTPGMIELGQMEDDANREFGRQAASACDLAVLIGGKRIEPIREGLLEEGFNPDNIWVAPSLNAGLERLKSYLKPGDTILLENDLPDQYNST